MIVTSSKICKKTPGTITATGLRHLPEFLPRVKVTLV